MTERIKRLLNDFYARDYRNNRKDVTVIPAADFAKRNLPYVLRVAERLALMAEGEDVILRPYDEIGFLRTQKNVPSIYTEEEREALFSSHFIFDGAQVGNISSDYSSVLNVGLEARKAEIEQLLASAEGTKKEFYDALLISIKAVYAVAEKYRKAAKAAGAEMLAAALENVPYYRPKSYYEALVFFRLINFMLWLNGNKHNTVGRFDQYMLPFYTADIRSGAITRERALELTEELFVSLNMDADLYPGVQQGDNGQSMMLGGCDKNGKECYNEFSKLCLEASLEVCLIDPKINLRVGKSTPDDIYYLGTLLTKKGLGFPQYSNDDVVIPALVDWGYDLEDARDYTVAACWEFIIPGVAMDIPNIDALSYPKAVNTVLKERLKSAESYEDVESAVRQKIFEDVECMTAQIKNMYIEPSPFQSLLMRDCVKEGKDISEGAKYNNFGLHGAGVSTAADSLAAVKQCVFDEKSVTAEELLAALDADFVGYEAVRAKLLAAPKMGNNEDEVDVIACRLMNAFADACKDKRNERGGIYRAGTGSAMYYIWYSQELGATADGRKAGEPFSANYSPSLNVPIDGVLSVVQSFTKPDLARVCNGGPLTLEFHDTLFRNEEGIKKVAALVKTFVLKGGHQMQLNAINRDTLLDAQKHPEKHANLIVRVWGWSGFFNELDIEYQNHIIKRLEFTN